jgi:hypothetical protein
MEVSCPTLQSQTSRGDKPVETLTECGFQSRWSLKNLSATFRLLRIRDNDNHSCSGGGRTVTPSSPPPKGLTKKSTPEDSGSIK